VLVSIYMRFIRVVLCAASVAVACGPSDDNGTPPDSAPPVDMPPGAPDAAPPELPRHEAGPYKAYLGTMHDHHYGSNAGDDGGLQVGAPDEPGLPGSPEWWDYRHNNPQYYAGGHASDVYMRAQSAGLDFFALTPHNHFIDNAEYGAVMTAANAADGHGIVALFGQEWSSVSSGNHAIVMNVEQRITAPNGEYDTLLDSWIPGYLAGHPSTLFRQKPFVILAHPALTSFDYGDAEKALLEYGIDDYATRAAWAAALNQHVRLVEMQSGSEGDENGLPRVMELLNDGVRVGFSVGPDNHRQQWGTRTDGRVGALASAWSREPIAEALYARRTYCSEDKDLGAHLAVLDGAGEPIAWMGEEIDSPGATLHLQVGLEDPSEPTRTYAVEVRIDDAVGGNQAMVTTVPGLPSSIPEGNRNFDVPAPPSGGYVVVHVTASDNNDVWFSPIWIR
jgi:hypothetical protein